MKNQIEIILKKYQILRENIWKERDLKLEEAKSKGYNAFTLENIEKSYSDKQFSSYERKQVEEFIAKIKGDKEKEEILNELVGKIMIRRDY